MQPQIKLLMISFHFPPISQSSGYLRALKFAKYLPTHAIEPTVLTINEKAYTAIDEKNLQLLDQLDKRINIYRASGFDSSKTLSFRGKYFSWLALPDNWVSWIPCAVLKALRLHKTQNFDAIWVTYPISSALFIGLFIAKLTGLPIYTDLRDPVWEEETWQNSWRHKMLAWVEKKLIINSKKVFFTATGTIEKYKLRYPQLDHEKFQLIANGFDEDDFVNLAPSTKNETRKVFLHSGLLPQYERDPSTFFNAIKALKNEGLLSKSSVVFRFRATGETAKYQQLVKQMNIDDLVEITERVSYQEALQEMSNADYLMIFQHRTCNWQVPAKLFEYIRLQRPMLLLAGKQSDTVALAQQAQCAYLDAEIDNVTAIKQAINACLADKFPSVDSSKISQFSRHHGAEKLAKVISTSLRN